MLSESGLHRSAALRNTALRWAWEKVGRVSATKARLALHHRSRGQQAAALVLRVAAVATLGGVRLLGGGIRQRDGGRPMGLAFLAATALE